MHFISTIRNTHADKHSKSLFGTINLTPEKRKKNHPLTDEEKGHMDEKVDVDITVGQVAGPFHSGEGLVAHLL